MICSFDGSSEPREAAVDVVWSRAGLASWAADSVSLSSLHGLSTTDVSVERALAASASGNVGELSTSRFRHHSGGRCREICWAIFVARWTQTISEDVAQPNIEELAPRDLLCGRRTFLTPPRLPFLLH